MMRFPKQELEVLFSLLNYTPEQKELTFWKSPKFNKPVYEITTKGKWMIPKYAKLSKQGWMSVQQIREKTLIDALNHDKAKTKPFVSCNSKKIPNLLQKLKDKGLVECKQIKFTYLNKRKKEISDECYIWRIIPKNKEIILLANYVEEFALISENSLQDVEGYMKLDTSLEGIQKMSGKYDTLYTELNNNSDIRKSHLLKVSVPVDMFYFYESDLVQKLGSDKIIDLIHRSGNKDSITFVKESITKLDKELEVLRERIALIRAIRDEKNAFLKELKRMK